MPFSVEDFQDLVRLLEQRPEWRDELRRLVLTEELLGLPALVRQLAEQMAALTDRVDALASRLDTLSSRVDALAEGQERLGRRVDQLTAAVEQLVKAQARTDQRLGHLRGFELEWRYHQRAGSHFGMLLRGLRAHTANVVVDQYEDRLSAEAAEDLLKADLVLQGRPRRQPERGEVWVVVEISATIDSSDLDRAIKRAGHLRSLGLRALPAVAGEHATETAEQRVKAEHVVLVQDGAARGWDEALNAWLG